MLIVNTLIVTLICVFVIDLTDFFDTIFEHVWKWIYNGKKSYNRDFDWTNVSLFFHPFFCSLCASFWSNLLILIFTSSLTIINLGWIAFLSFLTPIFKDMLITIRDLLTFLANGFKNPYKQK